VLFRTGVRNGELSGRFRDVVRAPSGLNRAPLGGSREPPGIQKVRPE